MATKYDLDELFTDFYMTAKEVLDTFEDVFGIEDVVLRFFGSDVSLSGTDRSSPAEIEAMNKVKASGAWHSLMGLYEYAVLGIKDDSACVEDIVIDGAVKISYLTTENCSLSSQWTSIRILGDARFSLDEGEDISISSLALLAGVDVRTVRNAASASELITYKNEEVNELYADNTSARNWLAGRRGFIPTTPRVRTQQSIPSIKRPSEFGHFIKERRGELGITSVDSHAAPRHVAITTNSMKELEAGAFKLPIDAVFPLADYLSVDRKELLTCVMRVFFAEELETIQSQGWQHA